MLERKQRRRGGKVCQGETGQGCKGGGVVKMVKHGKSRSIGNESYQNNLDERVYMRQKHIKTRAVEDIDRR